MERKETNGQEALGCELYGMLVETRQAMAFGKADAEIGMPSVDNEWERFRRLREGGRKRASAPLWTKVAACLAGVLLLSGAAFAAFRHYASAKSPDGGRPVELTQADVRQADAASWKAVVPTKDAPVIFNNVELQDILRSVGAAYDCGVVFRNERARTLRLYLQWDQDEDLEAIVRKLNHFRKVRLSVEDGNIVVE